MPTPDFSAQAATTQIQALRAELAKAANTIAEDAVRILEPDPVKRTRYANEARAVAQRLRQEQE